MSVFMLDGKLVNCKRTPEGVEAVASGKVQLNARQRQFWLVVDKTDTLNQRICEKLAEKINIGTFIESGLLAIENTVETTRSLFDVSDAHAAPVEHNHAAVQQEQSSDAVVQKHEELLFVEEKQKRQKSIDVSEIDNLPMALRFDWIKSNMCSSAEKTCGLLAANLVSNIERADTVPELERYIAPWQMMILDSNYNRTQVDVWLEQVKYAMNSIQN